MANVLTISGNDKYATISRSLLADGYNYYITVFVKGFGGNYFINESIKQINEIHSLREAKEKAVDFLNATSQPLSAVTIQLTNGSNTWKYEALSFDAGITEANIRRERMGLIGRSYLVSSCGKSTYIN